MNIPMQTVSDKYLNILYMYSRPGPFGRLKNHTLEQVESFTE